MKIFVITIFPEYFATLLNNGIVGQKLRGLRGSTPELQIINLRDYVSEKYKSVDDRVYGGGPGVVLRADLLEQALNRGVGDELKLSDVILLSPRGPVFSQTMARKLANTLTFEDRNLVFICGRYDGVDERFIEKYVNVEISLGDFIVSGGEIPAMAVIDSLIRMIPETLQNKQSLQDESFNNNLLAAPVYTRPSVFQGICVPEVLTSGHDAKIKQFNLEQQKKITQKFRPDLWEKYINLRKESDE